MQNYFDNEATSSTLHATMKPARGGKSLVTFSTYEVCSMHAWCTQTHTHTDTTATISLSSLLLFIKCKQ